MLCQFRSIWSEAGSKTNVSSQCKYITIRCDMSDYWRQSAVSSLSRKCYFCLLARCSYCLLLWVNDTPPMGVHHSAVSCLSVQKPCMVTPLAVWHTDSINLCLWSIWMGSEDIDWPGSICGGKYWFFILCQAKVSGLKWSVCTVWSKGFGSQENSCTNVHISGNFNWTICHSDKWQNRCAEVAEV